MYDTLATALRIEVTLLLAAFGAVVLWGMVTGHIVTRGLLSAPDREGPSGNNVQLLVVTCVAAGYYLLCATDTAATHVMPPVPQELILFLAGSHIAFTGMSLRSLFNQERNSR